MSTILSRIQEIVSKEGTTIGALERTIGASKGVLSRAINNGTDIQSKWIQRIVENYPLYSADWLLTGQGSMLRKKEPENEPKINYEYQGAPYYNVDFIGGFDIVLNDQTINPDYYINFAPYNKPGVVWCNITGHSMEPELNNGDFIAMKEITDPIEYLPYGEIYGIVTDSYRTIKRMRMSNRKGFVRLIPTNKSPEYGEQEIPISMIRKVFAVLGSMHRLF
jgi:hypothetical protein